MTRIGLLLTLVLSLVACGGGGSPDGGGAKLTDRANSADWTALDAQLDSYLTSQNGPLRGYGFVLFSRDGTLHTRVGGNQTVDTVLPIASASKMPSAAAILTLVDSGQLDLDEPVATYIAAAGNPIYWSPDKARITMRMLLAHTSGMIGLSDSQPNCLDRILALTLAQCAQLIAATPLLTAPGTAFNYGGADYQVAGYVATLIAGKDWHQLFHDGIAQPLGLTRFTYGDPATVLNPRIAGGAESDLGDYARILRMIQNDGALDGRRVLSSDAVRELKHNNIAGLPIVYAPFPQQARSSYTGYTLGFWVSSSSLHPGSAGPEFSDPGLFGTTPWIDEDIGYGAILLIDNNTYTGLDIWNAVRPLIIQQLG